MWRPLAQALSSARALRPASQCAICHAWPAEPVCDDCAARHAAPQPRCDRCALPVAPGQARCGACLLNPPPLDRCLAAVAYGYPWAGCIARFKFEGEPGWAGPLAMLMRSTPWVEPALERADWVLPVPLSVPRLRERGFNQALALARRLAPRRKVRADLLLRVRATESQHVLDRAARLRNMARAFAVEPLQAAKVCGRRVVLVDDVMTSGATLYAAAAALRQAGAAHVTGLVVARTA